MSFSAASPQNYGFEGDPLLEAYMNAKFSEEISEKMKVPKRITANGMEIGNHEILNGNETNSWNYYEKLDMTVPDRIVVMGQDQHLGKLNSIAKSTFSPLALPRSAFVFITYALFTFFFVVVRAPHVILCLFIKIVIFHHCRSIFCLSISFCCCRNLYKFHLLYFPSYRI